MNPPGEGACRAAIAASPHRLVPWYLMAAYLYYHKDTALLLDATFDQICKRLDAEWEAISHPHKHLIRREELSAGTCFLPAGLFPAITRSAALRLMETT